MKGTDKIIEQITQDARTQAVRILSQAREKSAQISADYHAQAEKLCREKTEEGKRAQQAQTESAGRLARMDGKKEILAAKQEMISCAFARAEEKLNTMDDTARTAFYVRLALDSCVTGEEEIILNPKDRAGIGDAVLAAVNDARRADGQRAALTLSAQAGTFGGGLVLRRDGIEVNCTTEILCAAARDALAADVAKKLELF